MRRWLFLTLLPICLFADKVEIPDETPWLTGPLLAPTAYVTPLGHLDIEVYGFAIAYTGAYDHHGKAHSFPTLWTNYVQPEFEIGISSNMDIELLPTVYYNVSQGAANWAFGDFPITWDIGLYDKQFKIRNWSTGIKLSFSETIPFGKYRNLNPKKNGTEIGGTGSWITNIGITWGNLFRLNGSHYFNGRLALSYSLPAPVHVKGFNYYGGGYGTDGTVYPAQSLNLDFAFEYTFTQNWVFAMDMVGNWSTRPRFKGKRGTTATGAVAPIKTVSSVQYSLAPAIEYNWSASIGLIAGSWFTVGGRNSLQFASFAAAFNYYY